MPQFVHLFPFSPWSPHGGTLRLRTGLQATQDLGVTRLLWWDRNAGTWIETTDLSEVAQGTAGPLAVPPPASPASFSTRAKRALFPSTLWESSRPQLKAAAKLSFNREDTVVLHTTYLAPLAAQLKGQVSATIVDAYDLIWRVHEMDAAAASLPLRVLRHAYSQWVERFEVGALRSATSIVAAGWTDFQALRKKVPEVSAHWTTTALPIELVPRRSEGPIRVGFIGNFEHSATVESVSLLLDSPLAGDSDAQVVLAGNGSEEFATDPNIIALGRVNQVAEFYSEIDVAAVPVGNGSGMKTKIAESALAGKVTITTRQGAEGFPPELRRALVVLGDSSELTARRVREAIETTSAEMLHSAFAGYFGPEAALARYQSALNSQVLPTHAPG